MVMALEQQEKVKVHSLVLYSHIFSLLNIANSLTYGNVLLAILLKINM